MSTVAPPPPGVLIANDWQSGTDAWAVTDPATGREIGQVAAASSAQSTAAVDAAADAAPAWAATPAIERGRLLRDAAGRLRDRADELATLLCYETGKLPAEARGEIALSAAFIEWYAEESRRGRGEVIDTPTGKRGQVLMEPMGPALLMAPWNFPVSIVARKLAPALAAGCPAVVKPSELAPLAVMRLLRCFQEAGVPAGVINAVTGSVEQTSKVLLADARLRVVSFTGSTQVGRLVAEQTARTLARPLLELGGDAPFIVCEDADLDLALEQLLIAKYRNGGQSCIAANRLLVHERVHDTFLERFCAASRALKVSGPQDPDAELGPVISFAARDRLRDWAERARAGGAEVVTGHAPDGPGSFSPPTVVLEPPADTGFSCDEVFGPALGAWSFADDDEALQRANDTDMGLAAYVMTRDLDRVRRYSDGLNAGIVGINDGLPPTPELPFGGFGASGYGKEGGHQGMSEFLRQKYVSSGAATAPSP